MIDDPARSRIAERDRILRRRAGSGMTITIIAAISQRKCDAVNRCRNNAKLTFGAEWSRRLCMDEMTPSHHRGELSAKKQRRRFVAIGASRVHDVFKTQGGSAMRPLRCR